jgi:hypothetical protein
MLITTMIGLVTLIPLIFTGIWALVDLTRILKWIEASKEEARRSATAMLFARQSKVRRYSRYAQPGFGRVGRQRRSQPGDRGKTRPARPEEPHSSQGLSQSQTQ